MNSTNNIIVFCISMPNNVIKADSDSKNVMLWYIIDV